MLEEWLRQAKTPETRARIRRWNRWATFSARLCVSLMLGGIAFIVWSVVTDRHHGLAFWGAIVGIVVLFLGCTVGDAYANTHLNEARFADGRESVGTVTEAIMNPGADGPDTYDIALDAVVSGAVLHRKVTGLAAFSAAGDRVRFRHNTLDPEDFDDIRFEGWAGSARPRSTPDTSVLQSRELYANAEMSVGRVTEVSSTLGIPGSTDPTVYTLTVSIDLPEGGALHRRIELGQHQLRPSGPSFRPRVRLLHNTRDPENLSDAFFDGWAT